MKPVGLDLVFSIKGTPSLGLDYLEFTFEELEELKSGAGSQFAFLDTIIDQIAKYRLDSSTNIIMDEADKLSRGNPNFVLVSEQNGWATDLYADNLESSKMREREGWAKEIVEKYGATVNDLELSTKSTNYSNKHFTWVLHYSDLDDSNLMVIDWDDEEKLREAVRYLNDPKMAQMNLALISPNSARTLLESEHPKRMLRNIIDLIGDKNFGFQTQGRGLIFAIAPTIQEYQDASLRDTLQKGDLIYQVIDIKADLSKYQDLDSSLRLFIGTRIKLRKSEGFGDVWGKVEEYIKDYNEELRNSKLALVEYETILDDKGAEYIEALIAYHPGLYSDLELRAFCFSNKDKDFTSPEATHHWRSVEGFGVIRH